MYEKRVPSGYRQRPLADLDRGRLEAFWSRSGLELFFLNGMNRMVVADVRPGATFDYSKPQTLFDVSPYIVAGAPFRQFDISPDGKRFLTVKQAGTPLSATRRSVVVVHNWFAELKARVPER